MGKTVVGKGKWVNIDEEKGRGVMQEVREMFRGKWRGCKAITRANVSEK